MLDRLSERGTASSRELMVGTAVTTVAAFFAFAFYFLSLPFLPDSDSYFHLAAARLYADEGLVRALPWTRFSVLGEAFGDKDLLLHLILVPFVTLTDPATGGRLAIAALNALLAGVLCWLGVKAIGRWGFVVAPWVYLTAAPLVARTVRLRPEILSLVVLLLAIPLAARRRYVPLALVAALYAWSHVSFHMLPVLAALWCGWLWLRTRRTDWQLLVSTFGGALAGVVLHPHFPDNTRIWALHTLVLPRRMQILDVGTEFQVPTLFTLSLGIGVWIGLVVFALASRSSEVPGGANREETSAYFAIATVVFGVLYARFDRMALYVIAFALMTLLFELSRRGRRSMNVPVLLLGMIVSIGAAVPSMRHVLRIVATQGASEGDLERFSRAVPDDATIAAQWGTTAYYSFWAPQGRYLNVLDPILMQSFDPRRYAIQRAMFEGHLPDAPLAAKSALDSDYIAFHRSRQNAPLFYRITADPRIEIRYLGDNVLAAIVPSSRFVLEWQGAAGPYPRLDGANADLEGYVDLRRILGTEDRCGSVTHRFETGTSERRAYRFVAYGPSIVTFDDETIHATEKADAAILARAVLLEIGMERGTHWITVRTCRASITGHAGFYLIEE